MSRLLGSPQERWSLDQAVDALVHAAARAGRPSWLWVVGLVYPSLNLSLDLVIALGRSLGDALGIELFDDAPAVSVFTLFAPVNAVFLTSSTVANLILGPLMLLALVPLFRLIVGLARLVDRGPAAGRDAPTELKSLRVGAAWRAGRGQGFAAYGMSLLLGAFVGAAFLLLLGPWLALHEMLDLPESMAPLFVALLIPFLALVWTYAVVLQVVHQLALMSLAQNQRGVLSALTHGWRLVRASPWASVRALLVDLSLFVTLVIVMVLVEMLAAPFELLVAALLAGFAGVTRAAYWAEVYRALGGASTVPAVEPVAGGGATGSDSRATMQP
ncbi:MAG: hypothetical protein WD226_13935 [Planctomycetota bacterium]